MTKVHGWKEAMRTKRIIQLQRFIDKEELLIYYAYVHSGNEELTNGSRSSSNNEASSG